MTLAVPKILGYPTSNWAFAAASVAVAISLFSLWFTVLSYRRAGFRVKVQLEAGRVLIHGLNKQRFEPAFTVTAVNTGHSQVQVRNVFWRRRRLWRLRWERQAFVFAGHGGPAWPLDLPGESEQMMPFLKAGLLQHLGSAQHPYKIRAHVNLRGGKGARSRGLKIDRIEGAVTTS